MHLHCWREALHLLRRREALHLLRRREALHLLCRREALHLLCWREALHLLCRREALHLLCWREALHLLCWWEALHLLCCRETLHVLCWRQDLCLLCRRGDTRHWRGCFRGWTEDGRLRFLRACPLTLWWRENRPSGGPGGISCTDTHAGASNQSPYFTHGSPKVLIICINKYLCVNIQVYLFIKCTHVGVDTDSAPGPSNVIL